MKGFKEIESLSSKPRCKECGKAILGRGKVFCSMWCRDAKARAKRFSECQNCGDQLTGGQMKFCSIGCNAQSKRVRLRYPQCLNCKLPLNGNDQLKYCSTECAYDHRAPIRKELRLCKECGEKIEDIRNKVFCSLDCCSKWNAREVMPRIGLVRQLKNCERCGTEFYRTSKKVKFCSYTCANKRPSTLCIKTCKYEFCENLFVPGSNQKFCSKSCSYTSRIKKPTKIKFAIPSKAARGGLSEEQYALWNALGSNWEPEKWWSPMGQVDGISHGFMDLANTYQKIDVEIDGDSHKESKVKEKDRLKDIWLTSQGWKVLRFSNEEVRNSLDSVVEKIMSNVTT